MRKKEKVRRAVLRHCVMYVGDQTRPGRPRFDRKRQCWRIPVLCADGACLGDVWLDTELNLVEVPMALAKAGMEVFPSKEAVTAGND